MKTVGEDFLWVILFLQFMLACIMAWYGVKMYELAEYVGYDQFRYRNLTLNPENGRTILFNQEENP